MLHSTDVSPDVEDAVVKQAKRFGDALPDRVHERPVLPEGLGLFVQVFNDLDTERSLAEYQPIPWSKIVQYGEYYQFPAADVEDLLYVIRQVDNAYLRRLVAKNK